MSNDKVSLILEMARMAKEADQKKQETAIFEKRDRTLAAIVDKTLGRVNSWLAEPEVKERLGLNIRSFFEDGDGETGSLMAYLDDGCGIYFGRVDYDAIARKDFGPYVLGLEKATEGSHYPHVLKIQVRAQQKLYRLLVKKLLPEEKLETERLNMEPLEDMLKNQKNGVVTIRFVSAEEIAFETEKSANLEPVVLGVTEDVIGTTPISIEIWTLNLLHKGEVLISRADWYQGSPKIPVPNVMYFDMYHVPKPRT